jgi:hypothetical protein
MRLPVLSYVTTCAVGAGLLAGCPDRTISKVTPVQTGAVTKAIPVSADVDILFVIDNSNSTADKQALFAANFPRFVQALDAFPSGRPNLHIGVVSTSVGTGSMQDFGPACATRLPMDDGLLQNTPRTAGCPAPTGRFIVDIKSGAGRNQNYTGTLDQALPCIATLGTTGCGFEAQLEAMKRALDGSRIENADFIRQGAYLAIVILTDEDDCSVRDPGIFSLNNVAQGDFRCQPLYAYKCDQAITTAPTGSYTNCKPLTGGYLQDTSAYFSFLASVKDPSQIVVAVIGGVDDSRLDPNGKPMPPNPNGQDITTGMITSPFTQTLALQPSCHNNSATPPSIGRPGIRLADFVSQFGSRGRYYSVCENDYSQALADIGTQLFNAISPCLEGKVDDSQFDPMATGQQLQCTASDVVNLGVSGQTETLIPPCTMQANPATVGLDTCTTGPCPTPGQTLPCWYVRQNPASCATTDTHLEIHVVRNMPPATGVTELVSCAITSM